MKNVLLASVALLLVSSSASFAAMPVLDLDPALSTVVPHNYLQLASDGEDDNGGGDDDGGSDDNGSSGASGDDNSHSSGASGNDDDDEDGVNDDNDDDNDDDSDNTSTLTKSKHQTSRLGGGIGCDNVGDVAEHPECGTN